MDIDEKREQKLIGDMIALYCKGRHGTSPPCADCAALTAYAQQRIDRCPHKQAKTVCSNCKTPCYQPQMRQKIRAVMRYAGPRILFVHPLLAIQHAFYAGRKK